LKTQNTDSLPALVQGGNATVNPSVSCHSTPDAVPAGLTAAHDSVSARTAANGPGGVWATDGMTVRSTADGGLYVILALAETGPGSQPCGTMVVYRSAGDGRVYVCEAGQFCARFAQVREASSEADVPAASGDWQPVMDEVARATRLFPTWPTDPLHALAILGEEFGELTKAVLQTAYEPHKVREGELRTEAVQTAAMALRFLASLDDYEFRPCVQHVQSVRRQSSGMGGEGQA